MRKILTLFLPLTLCFTQLVNAQSMFLPQQNKHLPFIERLEILLQKNQDLNLNSPKTIARHTVVDIAGLEDSSSGNPTLRLSKIDQKNIRSLLLNNAEYVTREVPKLGFLSTFYNNPANMLEVNKPRFFMALNPVFQGNVSFETNSDNQIFHNLGGLAFRTLVNNNLGFYASGVKNYEAPPSFVRQRINATNAVPGAGKFTLDENNNYQFWDIRAGVTFKALRFFDFQIAYDRNFIGNGYRSLFLSDFAGNYVFGKVNTQVWRFKYQHIYAPMVPQYIGPRTSSRPFGKKVMAFHHLSINATNWLNLAVFQAVTISTRADWQFMVPIIYYPVGKLTNNTPDNDLAGFEAKANIAKTLQVYGQALLDNFKLKDVKRGNGWWNNRFGFQAGLKYINAFTINNLDLQLELNSVRPYTYASSDTIGSHTHYNQNLAHPMGANFTEGIAILRYQPHKLITTSLRAIIFRQGTDTANKNFGTDILKSTTSRPAEYGFAIPTGVQASGANLQFLISYELSENLFIDGSAMMRKVTYEKKLIPDSDISLFSIGIRMNMYRKEYDY